MTLSRSLRSRARVFKLIAENRPEIHCLIEQCPNFPDHGQLCQENIHTNFSTIRRAAYHTARPRLLQPRPGSSIGTSTALGDYNRPPAPIQLSKDQDDPLISSISSSSSAILLRRAASSQSAKDRAFGSVASTRFSSSMALSARLRGAATALWSRCSSSASLATAVIALFRLRVRSHPTLAPPTSCWPQDA